MPRVYWMNERPRGLEHMSLHSPLRCLRGTFTRPQPRPAAPPVAPPQVRDADVEMKVAYPPLPTLPPPKHQASVPQVSRPANWIPAGRLPGRLPLAIPQNTEEFNHWAQAAHTPNNYPNLQRVHEYIRSSIRSHQQQEAC